MPRKTRGQGRGLTSAQRFSSPRRRERFLPGVDAWAWVLGGAYLGWWQLPAAVFFVREGSSDSGNGLARELPDLLPIKNK